MSAAAEEPQKHNFPQVPFEEYSLMILRMLFKIVWYVLVSAFKISIACAM